MRRRRPEGAEFDPPPVPELGVMPLCLASAPGDPRCANCAAVEAWCGEVDVYGEALSDWAERVDDTETEPAPYPDVPFCHRGI